MIKLSNTCSAGSSKVSSIDAAKPFVTAYLSILSKNRPVASFTMAILVFSPALMNLSEIIFLAIKSTILFLVNEFFIGSSKTFGPITFSISAVEAAIPNDIADASPSLIPFAKNSFFIIAPLDDAANAKPPV